MRKPRFTKVFSFDGKKIVESQLIEDLEPPTANEFGQTLTYDHNHNGIIVYHSMEGTEAHRNTYKLAKDHKFKLVKSANDNEEDYSKFGDIDSTFVDVKNLKPVDDLIHNMTLTEKEKKHNQYIQDLRNDGYTILTGNVQEMNIDEVKRTAQPNAILDDYTYYFDMAHLIYTINMPYKTIITVVADGNGSKVPDTFVYNRFFISNKIKEVKDYVGKKITIAVKHSVTICPVQEPSYNDYNYNELKIITE